MLPSQFKLLAKILTTELQSIHSSIREQVKAIRDTSEAANETRKEIPTHISELRIPKDEKNEFNTYRDKAHRQQILLTWCTGLAFLAAAYYASVARKQLDTMNSTLCEVRKQAEAAQNTYTETQRQTTLMHDQMVGTLGAYVFIEGPNNLFSDKLDIRTHGTVGVSFKNIGKVDAVDFVA